MIFYKCSLITFTILTVSIWVITVNSVLDPKDEKTGDKDPDVEKSSDKDPDVEKSGDKDPDVEKSGDKDPDVEKSGYKDPDVEKSSDKDVLLLRTGCKDLLINFTDFRDDKQDINRVVALKNDSNEKEYLKFVWSRSSIKCLMSTYVEFEKKFDDGKSTKIQIWNDISAELNKFGFSVTGEMCQRKWRTHTTTYKNIKEKNSKTGRGRDSWEYFDEMESIFSKDPSYTPLATISCGFKSVERHIDSSLYATATGASTNIMPPKSPDEPLAKKQKTNKKKVVSDHLEKIASHMADFNDIFRNLVQSESEKNALLKQLLDK
ncbi:uncharacterized protein LOC103307616 [Acyrthosiphon pisum]|uniref:Myb/SANT-like DNA-binding domain-containing protein n=1 Tax=Acyrthosiphon pisum TaxID=7029 RepID=A0A8R2NKY7_ACYPI|nr:uncharacterized protein LOC103307616 [Acyrthosiphon pisum]